MVTAGRAAAMGAAVVARDQATADRPETVSGSPLSAEQEVAASAAQRQPVAASPETLRLYAGDWAVFEDWCRQRSVVSLSADGAMVAEFLTQAATTLSAGALTRRAAAIAARHRQSGLASPTADPAVRAVLRLARDIATPRRAPPPKPATLIRMASHCPRDLAGMRDRALLLLAASGLSRAALVDLDVEQIRFTPAAVELSLDAFDEGGRARKGAEKAGVEEGRGAMVVIQRGVSDRVCPVQALRDWLDTSETRFGPVFRKIDRWGTLEHHHLGTDAIRRILARRAQPLTRGSRKVGKRVRERGTG
jgi:hypothetical protein